MVSDVKLAVALGCVLLFNSTLLAVITYKGAEYRSTIRARTEGFRAVGAALSGLAPTEPLAKRLGAVLDAVSGEFVFGSFNGTLPAFVQNTLGTNFAAIASTVSAWSAQAIATFGNVTCGAVLCDHANQVVQCGGRTQYCGAKGEYVNCDPEAGCIPQYIVTAAGAMKSVADRIAPLAPVPVSPSTPPALSNGIFRVDVVLDWFASQFDFSSWRAAGQVASNFVANVRHVDFSGCARDRTDQRTRCYDLNPAVTTLLDSINQVSSVLAPANVSYVGPSTPSPSTVPPSTLAPGSPGTPAPNASPGTGTPSPLSPTGTPAPISTATPVPNPPQQVPQVFTLTVAPGVTVAEAIANVAAALNVSVSSISVESTTTSSVQFTFASTNAAGLSEQLQALTATEQGRASLGIATLQSAAISSGTTDAPTNNDHLFIAVGAAVGGVVVGAVIGAIVYNAVKKPEPTVDRALLEMNMQSDRPGAL